MGHSLELDAQWAARGSSILALPDDHTALAKAPAAVRHAAGICVPNMCSEPRLRASNCKLQTSNVNSSVPCTLQLCPYATNLSSVLTGQMRLVNRAPYAGILGCVGMGDMIGKLSCGYLLEMDGTRKSRSGDAMVHGGCQ